VGTSKNECLIPISDHFKEVESFQAGGKAAWGAGFEGARKTLIGETIRIFLLQPFEDTPRMQISLNKP
jgi:hypothetical protein